MAYTRLGPFGYSSRNYGSFAGKAEAVVVATVEVTGGWWARPRRERHHEDDPVVVAPKRVRRILKQTLRDATTHDLAALREQAINAIAARHTWDEAYRAIIDAAIRDYAAGAVSVGPAILSARRRRTDDEEAMMVMMMALF